MEITEQELRNSVYYNGSYVDRDLLGIVEEIHRQYPELRVQYLEIATKLDQAPWRIIEKCKDGVDRVVLSVWQLDHTVLWKLQGIDVFKNPNLGKDLEEHNRKVKENIKKENAKKREEDRQLTAAIIKADKAFSFKSPHTDEKLTIRTDGTVKRERKRYFSES